MIQNHFFFLAFHLVCSISRCDVSSSIEIPCFFFVWSIRLHMFMGYIGKKRKNKKKKMLQNHRRNAARKIPIKISESLIKRKKKIQVKVKGKINDNDTNIDNRQHQWTFTFRYSKFRSTWKQSKQSMLTDCWPMLKLSNGKCCNILHFHLLSPIANLHIKLLGPLYGSTCFPLNNLWTWLIFI